MQKIIGITGGTGCGKTTALQALEALGFHIIDCDALYHKLLKEDKPMLAAIDEAFPGVVQDNTLDRKLLGQQVFSDPAKLEKLNEIVWPYVREAVRKQIIAHPDRHCAIDAIGLFESGLSRLCSQTIAVTAPEKDRVARLMRRDNISEEYALLRIRAQKSNESYCEQCHITLDNHFPTQAEFFRYAKETLEEKLL